MAQQKIMRSRLKKVLSSSTSSLSTPGPAAIDTLSTKISIHFKDHSCLKPVFGIVHLPFREDMNNGHVKFLRFSAIQTLFFFNYALFLHS